MERGVLRRSREHRRRGQAEDEGAFKTFFTRTSVSTFDRGPFQLTDATSNFFRTQWHFGKNGWPKSPRFFSGALPACEDDENALVDALQDKKTEFYKKIVEETAEARPGVLRLMDEAIADPSIAVGICSAATKAGR